LRSTDEAKYNRVNQRIIIREASHVSIYRKNRVYGDVETCIWLENLLNLTHFILNGPNFYDNSSRDEYVGK